jgi:uncharacterized protein YggT (Ycf19 family)
MALIDFLLNLAGLLLWLNWLSVRFDPLARASAATLIGTLRKASKPTARRWLFIVALAALLLLRALLYCYIGSAADWSPKLHLGAITLSFRSDFFHLMLAYSALSFVVMLACFYGWMLLLSFLGAREGEDDPFLRLARAHLGWVARWPWVLRFTLPFIAATVLWLALSPVLTWLGVVPRAGTWLTRCEQATLLGLGAYLAWKYLIIGLLAVYLLHSYVYLGRNPFWSFVTLAARALLKPLRRLPVRVDRVDLAPVVGIALVFLAAHFAENGLSFSSDLRLPGLPELYLRVSR